jgi:hypothetical protein
MTLVDMVAVADHINDQLVCALNGTDLAIKVGQNRIHGSIRVQIANPHGSFTVSVIYLHGGYRMGQLEFVDTTELAQYVAAQARRHFSV